MNKGWIHKNKKSKRKKEKGFDRNQPIIPPLVEDCISFLEQEGLSCEGIFRVPGSQEEILKIKAIYDSGKQVHLSKLTKDPYIVSDLLKMYFRNLDEALLTWELYDCFIAAISMPQPEHKIICLKKVINLLPIGNKTILARLMCFLHKVAENEEFNKMSSSNLAIVFSPTLNRSKEDNLEITLKDASLSILLIETLIKHPELFQIHDNEDNQINNNLNNNNNNMENFNQSLKISTIKLAKSFLKEEEFIEKTNEEISPQEQKLLMETISKSSRKNTNKTTVFDIFDFTDNEEIFQNEQDKYNNQNKPPIPPKNYSTPIKNSKPPVDRSKKYKNKNNEFDIQGLLHQLLIGNSLVVERYLDTLEIDQRTELVKQLNELIDQTKI